jgi:glutamate-1-semialdehyde 2,1-aminomutase
MEGSPMANFLDTYRGKTSGSENLFKRSREVMPGGISHNIHYFPPYPLFVQGAKGSKFWDVDGNEYIDLWMGHYTHILGHHSHIVVEAIERQLKDGIHWGIVFEKQVEMAELLRELVPSAEMVRYCCSGTEATMYAVRIARAFKGKNTILKIAGGWHGANPDLTLGIKWPFEQGESLGLLPDLQRYTKTLPFNDLDGSLKVIQQNKKDLAGIIIEPVVGEGGFVPASMEYLHMLRSETAKLGALLIFDEVISGFRVALGGAQERFGITPDLTTLGKIMGGGLPVGAVVGQKEILSKTSPELKEKKWERIVIGGGTFSSHPLTVAAGLAMLHHLKDQADEIYPVLEAKGKAVREGIQKALRHYGIKSIVTGIGSLFQTHFPYKDDAALDSPHTIYQLTDVDKRENEFRIRMLTKGVHVMHGGGAVSTAHSDRDIDRIIQAAGEVGREMSSGG